MVQKAAAEEDSYIIKYTAYFILKHVLNAPPDIINLNDKVLAFTRRKKKRERKGSRTLHSLPFRMFAAASQSSCL